MVSPSMTTDNEVWLLPLRVPSLLLYSAYNAQASVFDCVYDKYFNGHVRGYGLRLPIVACEMECAWKTLRL